jgi:hypothetical protein
MKPIVLDDSVSNSDWIKQGKYGFDFPFVETVEDFERQFRVPSVEPARGKRLEELAKLPWVDVAPEPIRVLLLGVRKSVVLRKMVVRRDAMVQLAFIKASFGGDRSAAGRYAAEQRWKGHVKAGVKVPATAKAKDITEELKTYFGTDTETYQKSQGYEDVRQRLIDQQKRTTGQGDLQLELIAKKQGFDGLPKVVSSEEMSRLEKEGWTIAYRGIEDSEEGSGEDFAEQFRTGEYFAGLGVYGNGIYFASERAVAKVYSGGSGGGGAIIKIAIPPNVILTESDFKERLAKHRDTVMDSSAVDQWGTRQGEFYGGSDLGRALAAQGVRGASLTGFVMSKTSEVIIIWDRSMLAVEESKKTK